MLPALLLLLAAGPAAGDGREVGPPLCHPDCLKYGTCGEDGHCRCPFGRNGEACEIDVLAPCRQFPDSNALCDPVATKSCECWRRCREWFCPADSQGREVCHGLVPPRGRACYRREVPPDEQYSRIPEPEEEKQVKCFRSWDEEAEEIPCSEAMVWEGSDVSLPLSRCKDSCNKRGYCMRRARDPEGTSECRCNRSFKGASCESEEVMCLNGCNGRGKCFDDYCHCKPPYFSFDCSRSKVYPANYSWPSPVELKIYMYELGTRLTHEGIPHAGFQGADPNYLAYWRFLEQFLVSPVRTEDPSEANLFYVPDFVLSYTGNLGSGSDHFHLLIDHIRMKYPYWNRTGGRDHFLWLSVDRGACELGLLQSLNLIKIVHFGMHSTPQFHSPSFGHMGPLYGCTHPLRDVVATPNVWEGDSFLERTRELGIDELIRMKERQLFFAGDIGLDDEPAYSGNTRQTLYKVIQEWQDPEFQMLDHGVEGDYERMLRTSRFCLAPYGWGYGMRLGQAMLAGCVPLIIQEHCIQQYEDVLPYEDFSIRLSNEDLPHLREILRGVSEGQYRRLLEGVLRYMPAFSWDAAKGGKAFDYTIASLRRKHLNFKSLYYGVYHNDAARA